MITRYGVILPEAKDLPALPKRVILHWTGGGHRANAVDREHYHYIVEADGAVVPGFHTVAQNMRTVGPSTPYAAHTGGFNSFSVGLSAAGMADYLSPSSPGRYPLTRVQVHRLCELGAYFCELGGLDPLDPAHLFTHREAWTIHRVKGTMNDRKLDIEHLPYAAGIGKEEVGPHLRRLAYELGRAAREPVIPAVDLKVVAPQRPARPAAPTIPPHLGPITARTTHVRVIMADEEPKPSLWRRLNPFRRVSMRAIFARFAAAIVAVIITFLAGALGIEVTEDTRATLTEAVTLLGLGLYGIVYAVVHRLISRRINPMDAAKT